MHSLYSIGFARSGCQVTLAYAKEEGTSLWPGIGLSDRLKIIDSRDLKKADWQWDLCVNFMLLPTADDPRRVVMDLADRSSKYVMFIHVNRFNVGFNMHRTVH